jgi:hypothetical protein
VRTAGGLARAAAAGCAALAVLLIVVPAAPARPRPPVVLVVFDEFPTTSLLGKGRRVDARRYPNFARLAAQSTWFRNATTVHDSTFVAMPAILTGRVRGYLPGAGARPPRRSLFTLLKRQGYRVNGSEEGAHVCPVRLCGRRHGTRWFLVRSRMARFSRFIRSIRPSRRPYLHFKHTLLPHVPWIYLPSGRQYAHGPFAPIRGVNSALGVRDRGLVRLAYQRHLLQVGAVDRAVGRLVRQLRATGLWRRSLVVVTADHGVSFRLGERDRRTVTPGNVQNIAPVPLFVKRPRQRHGKVSLAYARTVDIVPTIASVLRIRVPWRTRGSSLFSRAVARRRTVRVGGRAPASPVVKLRARAFQGRWSRAIAYQHWLFGYGRRGRGLYGIGPNPELLGRGLDRLRVARAAGLRATVLGASDLQNVEPRRRFRPAFVTGHIRGARRGRRDLAVAVNGRIAAVTKSFRLGRRQPESFACMVPESTLVPGRNFVHVLLVERRRRRLRLRLLGGA